MRQKTTSSMKSLLPILVLYLFSTGSMPAHCPVGDLNDDCKVTFLDLQIFAEQWLALPESPADLNGDDMVNIADLALLAEQWYQSRIPIVINEFMASNDSSVQDPQGQYDDWVELYNFGTDAIDVGGVYLTDNLSVPTKWQIPGNNPAATTIPADGYLLIWADDDTTDTGLHANFKLDADGEEIGLFDTNGTTLIDSITSVAQVVDISYGRYPDANSAWRYMSSPTPGRENSGAYLGAVADTEFSHDRGFYDVPFDLRIICSTPEADIYYTIDGNAPIENDIPTVSSTEYSGPIHINTTTCIRAVAIRTGWMSSNVDTHTYIFNASDTVKSLPVISLVGDEYKTFYEPDGIMAIVGGYYSGGVWQSDGPGSYNNPIHRGRAYERPVSFEILNSQARTNLQIDCGIRVHGSDYTRPRYTRGDNWLCNNNKFSFNLFFRGSYGNSRLEYAFFPFVPVERYRSIVLRAGHNDICSPFIKDEWVRRLFLEMGAAQLTGVFANLYINGEYKGYYNPCGRLDEEFFQEWFDTNNSFDIIDQAGLRDGDWVAWNDLLSYADSHSLSNTADYEYVADRLDIQEFIDFLILEIHIGNFDWPGNNWAVYREKTDGAKFRPAVWDAEGMAETWIFGNNCEYCYKTAFEDFPSWTSPTGLNHLTSDPIARLYRALKANADFRQLFADRIHKHFRNGGILTESHLLPKWWEVQNEVAAFLPYQSTFVPDIFLPKREPYVLAAFEENGLFNLDIEAPIFNINGSYQHGGYISAGDILNMTNPNSSGTVYFTMDGTDPAVPGAPPQQVIDTILAAQNAAKRALVPTGDVDNAWKGGDVFDDSGWMSVTGSPGGVGYERGSGYEQYISLDVAGQMYNRASGCYIRIPFEITEDSNTFELMILKVRYDDGFVAYINGVEVQRALVSGTPSWNSYASGGHEAGGLQSFDISDETDLLREGKNILAIHGLNVSRTSSDFIISAELVAGHLTAGTDPGVSDSGIKYTGAIKLTRTTHVKARVLSGNTLSALNEAVFAIEPVKENLRITEIMYHPLVTGEPEDPNTEFVELTNISEETINLNLVKFANGVDFTFGDVELAPGGFVLVVKDESAFLDKYPSFSGLSAGQYTGSLNNAGERITLEDAIGQPIHDFRYRDNWYDITDGLGFSLTVKDPANTDPNAYGDKANWRPSAAVGGSPGYDDSFEVPELGSVVINEILTHSHAGEPDWIELHNTTEYTINIGGWFLSDDDEDLTKYEIAAGAVIPANGYMVFYEDQHFGNLVDPGCHVPFALSENGETLYLHSGRDGQLTGYSEQEKFGASETGVAFGRYRKSTGTYNFVAMSANTPGAANAYPKVGPIVISEIMYHPDIEGDAEYVELLNITDDSVLLHDSITGEPWRFTDDPDDPGLEFLFPTDPPVTVDPGEYILLLKDVETYSARFGEPVCDLVFEWGPGKLSNGSEKVQLSKPGDVDEQGVRQWIRVDRVAYSDGSHPVGEDPWPVEADGDGKSLTRKVPADYGNDPDNWTASAPSPGTMNP